MFNPLSISTLYLIRGKENQNGNRPIQTNIVSDFFSSLPFSNAKSYTYCTILSKKTKATHQLSPQNTIILQDQRPILAEVETQSMTLTITQLRLGIAGKNYK